MSTERKRRMEKETRKEEENNNKRGEDITVCTIFIERERVVYAKSLSVR